jgi:hypothetical protein
MRLFPRLAIWLAFLFCAQVVVAGPVLINGTDADDHGSATTSANLDGWLYIQRALEAMAPKVRNGQKVVVCLGCNSQVAVSAFISAFDKSSLPASGWSRKTITSSLELNAFYSASLVAGVQTIFGTGIVYMPSDRINALGGLTEAQLDIVNANATALSVHLEAGGGLFTLMQAGVPNGYGWLKSLIPGAGVSSANIVADAPLLATPAFTAAFPTLPFSSLGTAAHAHAYFTGPTGGLSVLATGETSADVAPDGDQPKASASVNAILGGADVDFAAPAQGVPIGGAPLISLFIALVAAYTQRQR